MIKNGDLVKVVKVLKSSEYPNEKRRFVGQKFTVTGADFHSHDKFKHHLSMGSTYDWADSELQIVKKPVLKTPFFLLKYEIKSDPIEEIQTMEGVQGRIQDLFENHGGHSFEVFEVSKKIKVEVTKKTEIKFE